MGQEDIGVGQQAEAADNPWQIIKVQVRAKNDLVREFSKLLDELKALDFASQVDRDQNRIDTSKDPVQCPKCGSYEHERLCCGCNKLF